MEEAPAEQSTLQCPKAMQYPKLEQRSECIVMITVQIM